MTLLLLACAANKPGGPGDTAATGTSTRPDDTATDVPVGPFTWTDVEMGSARACGLLADGDVLCWGEPPYEDTPPPPGERFSRIFVGEEVTCGWTLAGEVLCWGDTHQFSPMMEVLGTPLAFDMNRRAACALYEGGRLDCWGDAVDPPVSTGVSAVTVGLNSCLAQEDPTLWTCWGVDPTWVIDVPGPLRDVDAGWGVASGIDPVTGDGVAWGFYTPDTVDVVTGPMARVVAGYYSFCVLWETGEAGCSSAVAPSGAFVDVSTDQRTACGVRPDGSLECWGDDEFGLLDYPR